MRSPPPEAKCQIAEGGKGFQSYPRCVTPFNRQLEGQKRGNAGRGVVLNGIHRTTQVR